MTRTACKSLVLKTLHLASSPPGKQRRAETQDSNDVNQQQAWCSRNRVQRQLQSYKKHLKATTETPPPLETPETASRWFLSRTSSPQPRPSSRSPAASSSTSRTGVTARKPQTTHTRVSKVAASPWTGSWAPEETLSPERATVETRTCTLHTHPSMTHVHIHLY